VNVPLIKRRKPVKSLELAIQSDDLVCRWGDKRYSKPLFLFFAREIGRFFSRTFFIVPEREQEYPPDTGEFFLYDNQEIVPLKPYQSVIEYYKKMPFFLVANTLAMFSAIRKSDVVMLRLPSMNCVIAFALSLIWRRPMVTYYVGDQLKIVREGTKYSGRVKKHLAVFAATINRVIETEIIKRSRVAFFLGSDLKRTFDGVNKRSYVTFTSLVRKEDIVIRRVCENKVIRIVYAGRLAHEKGLAYLMEAFRRIEVDGRDVEMVVVGDGDLLGWLKDFVISNRLVGKVLILGYQNWDMLNRILLDCDIFVMPSVSEGIPKVLLEVMAKGLPIVATNVGGIPDIITHMENGVLVPPKSSEAIAESVKLLVENSALRNRIVENGYRFVREHTVDAQARKIAEAIHEAVEK
jgi:glycosyltransferase involved in cell wall biosynthesis